jgi:hypothetical protein
MRLNGGLPAWCCVARHSARVLRESRLHREQRTVTRLGISIGHSVPNLQTHIFACMAHRTSRRRASEGSFDPTGHADVRAWLARVAAQKGRVPFGWRSHSPNPLHAAARSDNHTPELVAPAINQQPERNGGVSAPFPVVAGAPTRVITSASADGLPLPGRLLRLYVSRCSV